MTTHTFVVSLPPTARVPIAIVSFEDPFVYDHDMIMTAKEALAHIYGVDVDKVSSGEEYADKDQPNPLLKKRFL